MNFILFPFQFYFSLLQFKTLGQYILKMKALHLYMLDTVASNPSPWVNMSLHNLSFLSLLVHHKKGNLLWK